MAIAGYAVVTLRTTIPTRAERERQIVEQEKRNVTLAQEVERKREFLKRVGESPALQQLIIQDRLKMVGPHDKVYVTDPAKK